MVVPFFFGFVVFLSLPYAKTGDQSDHLNLDFFGDAFGVQKLFGFGSV
jgi:hypothetical protein